MQDKINQQKYTYLGKLFLKKSLKQD